MFGNKTVMSFLPTIISMAKVQGFDVDIEFNKALEFIPKYLTEKQAEYKAKYPELQINLMVSFYENDVYFIPVGIEKIDEKITVTKQFESVNITKLLNGIKVTELINILKENPDLSIMEAVEKSRVK